MWSFFRSFIMDPQATPDDVNLLLLGETGVGKSTLINSISNYFIHSNFAKAQKGKVELLIPVCLNVSEQTKVYGKPDGNEVHEPGQSVTQNVKVYLFPIKLDHKTINLRLIDTPGVGDPRGIEQDNINLDNVLAYLATLKELHGICFVLKANQTRFTKFAEYCLKQILTRLDKSASQNIIFITTYSKTSSYTAGETKSHCLAPLVRSIRSRPPHVSIPLSDKNIFAVDNEAFKALLEIQEGTNYHRHAMKGFEQSWIKSAKEIQRLLKYIIGDSKHSALKPHDVENTVSINEVRFLIEQLTTPIAEVSELIQDNIRVLDKHQKSLQQEDQTLDQLKDQLYIPCVDLEVKELNQPVTVCTEPKCTEIVKVNNVTLRLYKQQCHKPCYLKGVPKEMVGDPQLEDCGVMTDGNCMYCHCSWKKHLHIYKETQKVEVKKEDQNVKNTIKSKEDARVHIEKTLNNVNQRRTELEAEGSTISKTIAKFAYFLQEHALTPFNDLYSAFIKQRITDEKHLGKFADQQVITKLESMLKDHEQLQKTLQENPKGLQTGGSDLTLEGIKNSVTELYNLKHMGKKIQELINKSSNSRRKEHQENFSCLVSQEIDLNKNIAEEQYESMEYSESYYDVSGMQQGWNKSSENEYGPEATGDNHYDDYTSYGSVYTDRATEEKLQTSRFDHASNARQHPRRTPERSSPYPRKRDDYSREDIYEDTSRGHGPRNQHSRDSDDRRRESMAQHNTRAHQRYKGRYETSPSRRENLYSSGRSKSPEDYYDPEAEKSSHRGHRSNKYSSRHDHRGHSRSHESDSQRSSRRDHTAKHRHGSSESSYSDGSHSAESYGSRHSVKQSKNQRGSKSKHYDSDNDHSKKTNRSKNTSSRRSKDREVYDKTRAETKSKHKTHDKVKESSRRHRHRSDSHDPDEPIYATKSKHSKHEDKSYSENSDSDGNYSSRNTDKQSKNQRDTKSKKNYDSDGNRSTKPSKTKHSASKSSHESRDKSAAKSKSGHKKQTESRRQSSPVDIKSSKEKASKIQKKPKSEDEESSGSSSQDSSHSSDHRPDKSSKSRRQETRDPDDKSSERSSRSGHKKHTESKKGRKSSPVGQRYESDDQQHNKSSRKKHRSKERESKRSKQPKSENENSDSEAKSSKNGGKVPKSGQETRNRSDKSKNSTGSGHKKSAESKTAKPFMKEESKRRQKHKSEDENSDSDGKEPINVSSQKHEQSSQPSSDRSNKSSKTKSQGKSRSVNKRDESDDPHSAKSPRKKHNTKATESKSCENPKPADENYDSGDKFPPRVSSDSSSKNQKKTKSKPPQDVKDHEGSSGRNSRASSRSSGTHTINKNDSENSSSDQEKEE